MHRPTDCVDAKQLDRSVQASWSLQGANTNDGYQRTLTSYHTGWEPGRAGEGAL